MATMQEAASQTGGGREQRAHVRYPVDGEATLLLVSRNQSLRCRIVDLSLHGCCVRCQQQLSVANGTRIEISFKVNGISFRFSGTIQWTDGRNQAGIQFPNSIPRQAEDLRVVLAELEATARKKAADGKTATPAGPESVVQQARQPAESPAQVLGQAPGQAPEPALNPALNPALVPALDQASLAAQPPKPPPAPAAATASVPPSSSQPGRDRRAQERERVDTAAAIFVVKSGSRLDGRIVDLSPGGCGIRIAERFPLGIYTRVEVEFQLEGLPFRLAGVIQSIRDPHTVGIRFLNMSERKQSQVTELIAEIRELQSKPEQAVGPGS